MLQTLDFLCCVCVTEGHLNVIFMPPSLLLYHLFHFLLCTIDVPMYTAGESVFLKMLCFFAEQHPMNIDFPGHAAQNDSESDSYMDSGTDTDSDSDSDSDADSSSDSGSDLGDVFDFDDSSDSDGAGDGASVNDQCVDIIWAKAARGVWGLAHVFNNKLFFTRDIMDDDAVPKHFNVPEPNPKPKPKPAPKPNAFPSLAPAWPQGAAQKGIKDGVSQEEGFHVRTSRTLDHSMHVGRHTTAQSAEIHSFGVHLSMWLTVGKERARMPRRNVSKNFFSAVRGCPRSCARTSPWFCGQILGGKRAQQPPPGSAVKHCRCLGTGAGRYCICMTRVSETACQIHSPFSLPTKDFLLHSLAELIHLQCPFVADHSRMAPRTHL